MLTVLRLPTLSLLTASFLTFGCHAQQPPANIEVGKPLPAATAFRVEALLRRKADLPPGSTVNLGPAESSDVTGFDKLTVTISNEGASSHPLEFLIAQDGSKFEQVTSFDLTPDPRKLVSAEGRPARGGPESAPVTIVGFDDLECPYCSRLHQSIFPAIQDRYGDKVHIVYRDYPLTEIHPWAEHAAVDVECLAAQSPASYWSAVDKIHAQYATVGSDPSDPKKDKTVGAADQQLDGIARGQAQIDHLNVETLNACMEKQDAKAVEASKQLAESLGLQSAPTLFINGDKIDGAVPIEFIFGAIDRAMLAQGLQPPAPYAPKVIAAPPVTPAAAPKGK